MVIKCLELKNKKIDYKKPVSIRINKKSFVFLNTLNKRRNLYLLHNEIAIILDQ